MVTSNVDAVYDSHVGNHARFVSHDVVNFVFSVSHKADVIKIETVPVGGYRKMPHVSPFNESMHLLTQLE